jgi:hypothetical protein
MENILNLAHSQTAYKFIQFYGGNAEKEAAEQAASCARRGDMESSENWNWIAKAINEIQSREDLPNNASFTSAVGLT